MAKGSGIYRGQILQRPDYVQPVVLAAGTGQAFDVPTGMGYVVFSMDADFWAKWGSTNATVPTTSSTAGTSSPELNPTARDIGSTLTTTGLSLIAGAAAVGSMSWFARA